MTTNSVVDKNAAAVPQALLPDSGIGVLSGFRNIFAKELADWFGTRRWWIQTLIWLIIFNVVLVQVLFVAPVLDPQASGGPDELYMSGLGVFFNMLALLGSIGVIAQLPNFNRLLDSHGIDFEQITAGEYQRTVTMFGKNTDADRRKLKSDLEDVHTLFKAVVGRYRSALDLEKVATGEHWYGTRALELGLADELRTSDELLGDLAAGHDVYRLDYKIKQPLQKKVLAHVDGLLETVDASGWRRRFETRLPR